MTSGDLGASADGALATLATPLDDSTTTAETVSRSAASWAAASGRAS